MFKNLAEFSKPSGEGTPMISKNGSQTICRYHCFKNNKNSSVRLLKPNSLLGNPRVD